MKKATTVSCCLLFALIALLPAGMACSACFGCTFEIISVTAFAIITAIVSVCTVVFCLMPDNAVRSKAIGVLLAVSPLLSLVNAVMCIFERRSIGVIVSVFVSVVCCCFLSVKCGKPSALKVTALVLSALMVLPIWYLSVLASIFGNISQNTPVKTVESPNREYYAEVIDSDQGALGGNTFVDVYKNSGIDAVIFKIKKKPQRVYSGAYGEFENMNIYWKSERILVINSVEYEIAGG